MLQLSKRRLGGVVVLDLAGRLTAGAGAKLLTETFRALEAEGRKNVLINFAGVDFIDSTGIGALMAGTEMIRRGGQVRIMNSTGAVQQVFQITRLNRVFPNYADEQSALQSFGV